VNNQGNPLSGSFSDYDLSTLLMQGREVFF